MTDYVLLAVVVVVALLIIRSTLLQGVSTVDVVKDIDATGQTEAEHDEPTVIQDYTPRMLSNYNGFDLEKVYMAIRGNVYDVSAGRRFYGPSGPYNNFAGHDASRGLAKNSFEIEMVRSFDEPIDDLADLNDSEWKSLANWEAMLKNKYPVVGKLVSEADYAKSDNKATVMD